jgi:hypothetical protein
MASPAGDEPPTHEPVWAFHGQTIPNTKEDEPKPKSAKWWVKFLLIMISPNRL